MFRKKPGDPWPPHVVYRADFREHEADIFKNGMASSGTNTDLLSHYKGDSCNYKEATSAFVATSAVQAVAVQYAEIHLNRDPSKAHIYVYTIRATDNFYELKTSLLKAGTKKNDPRYQKQANLCCADHEWIAYLNIPANQIKSATRYVRDPNNPGKAIPAVGKPIDQPVGKNGYKQDSSSRGNPKAFDEEKKGPAL